MIHLDSNGAIALLNQRQPQVRTRFDAALSASTRTALSVIVYCELMDSAAASERRESNENRIAVLILSGRLLLLPFDGRMPAMQRISAPSSGGPDSRSALMTC